MKFKVLTADWTAALSVVSSITPASVDSKGSSGYLCVLRRERCDLYSDDGKQRFRVPVPVFDVEGEGAFVFPTGQNGDLRYVDGSVEFEAVEEAGAHVVWCRRDPGESRRGGVHKMLTFSPQALKALDADLGKSTKTATFSVALLREALAMTRPYLSDPKDPVSKPEHVNVQLFGEDAGAGDGYMLGCSISKTGLFYSPDLEGKRLFVYGPRIPLLLSFLAKSTGEIDVYQGENSTYFMNASEQVLGWTNQDYAGTKFGIYGLALDRHILKIPRATLEKELKYVRSTLPADRNKAFLTYDHVTSCLRVGASNPLGGEIESLPLAVTPLVDGDEGCWGTGDLGKTESVQFNVNLDLMIQIVEATKHPRDVILGIAKTKKANTHLIRIKESYAIDEQGKYVERPTPDQKVISCQALRWIPSKQ